MRYRLLLLLCLTNLAWVTGFSQQSGKIDLTGVWQFREQGSTQIYNGTVPGYVTTDLLKNKLIPDPYYRDNESKVQWISDTGWVYERYFTLEPDFFRNRSVDLVFEGLDTYANVYLNDSLVLVTDNMFKEWVRPVKYILRNGTNKLRVEFPSILQENARRYADLDYKVPGDERSVCRKAAYQFGWDWAPKLVSPGIWKPVYLRYWNIVNLLDVRVVPVSKPDSVAKMTAVFTLVSTLADTAVFRIAVDSVEFFSGREGLKKGVNVIRADFAIRKPKLWWPNGMGKQPLYTLGYKVEFAGKLVAEGSKKFGIRTVRLVQERDSSGRSFYFNVNDKPVYAKGANYVPMDQFPTRVSDSVYEALIGDVAKAHMNMLRVWGGGIYERDRFYELCDEKGILVWQDFMFANAMIPPSNALLTSIRDEVIQNIVRLRDHPCIVAWCGNNEIEEGWRNWGWVKQYGLSPEDSASLYKATWGVFNDIIANSVRKYDTLRPYIPTSPKYGWGRPKSLTEGDSHYWGVWWGREPFGTYAEKIPRFMSEFGFQGYPDETTLKAFTLPGDVFPGSAVLSSHQKHPEGFSIIDEYMKRDFRQPKDFGMYRYVSQVLQADGIVQGIEAQRRSKPHCQGSLVWQLNDSWPGISWSAQDYYGNKKALWYRMRNIFMDQFVSTDIKDDTLRVYCTTDDGRPQEIDFRMMMFDFSGNVIWKYDSTIDLLDAKRTMLLAQAPLEYLLQGCRRDSVFIYLDLRNIIGIRAAKNLYLVPYKDLDLRKPAITKTIRETDEGYVITLSTDTQALYVRLSTDIPGTFSDNYFDMIPKINKPVLFKTKTKDPDFEKKLQIISLADSYLE